MKKMSENLTMNQVGVLHNPHQRMGDHKRVVTVCSAGCLRSPTAAVVLSQDPFNFNTRPVGLTDEYAIIRLDDALVEWADEFVVMEEWMEIKIREVWQDGSDNQARLKIITLNIPDRFAYRDPELMDMIKKNYLEITNE